MPTTKPNETPDNPIMFLFQVGLKEGYIDECFRFTWFTFVFSHFCLRKKGERCGGGDCPVPVTKKSDSTNLEILPKIRRRRGAQFTEERFLLLSFSTLSIKQTCKNCSIMVSRDQPFDMQMKILMIGDSGKFRLIYLPVHQK
jgi:hypothetical protein